MFLFSFHNTTPEPRHRAIPVFYMLIGKIVFTRMSQSLFKYYQRGSIFELSSISSLISFKIVDTSSTEMVPLDVVNT